jgi:hypothetical protein
LFWRERFSRRAMQRQRRKHADKACATDPMEQEVKALLRSDGDVALSPDQTAYRARSLIENGFAPSSVIAQLALAETALGHTAAVQHLVDLSRFLQIRHVGELSAQDLRDVATIFLGNLTYYEHPERRAIRQGWRYDALDDSREPALRRLMSVLRATVEAYIAGLSNDPRHPFLATKPARFGLKAWGVISGSSGYHQSHIHSVGWASGVFYVSVPPLVDDNDARIGWLRVGPPSDGDCAGWDERWIKPEPGLAILMPAYFYHGTQPMGRDVERICVAFDVIPEG